MTEVTVVIPLYNKAPYIARTLNSVLNQTFQNFEVIVIDDGSTDDGGKVVRGFDDLRIRLIQQENRGVSAARNRGIEEAKAELIAFLDADDEWKPVHLETIMKLKQKYPDAGAYSTSYLLCESHRIQKYPKYEYIPSKPWEGVIPDFFLSAALGRYPVNSSVICIPKSICTEIGGFNIHESMGEDIDVWGKIALKYPIIFSWEVGAIYHLDPTNRTCNKVFLEQQPFVKFALDAIKNNTVSQKVIPSLTEYIMQSELERALSLLVAGDRIRARTIAKKNKARYKKLKQLKLICLISLPPFFFKIGLKIKQHFNTLSGIPNDEYFFNIHYKQ